MTCAQELTGELPVEIPLEVDEAKPIVRRRVGTSFTLSPKVIADRKPKIEIVSCSFDLCQANFGLLCWC